MPISNDPLNRKWLDVSSSNPHLVDEFRPTLVSFLAYDRGKRAKFMGSGFIIGGDKDGQYAQVLTAKHVLDGVRDFQKPEQKHALSALPEFTAQKKLSIKPPDLKVIWMGQKNASMMSVVYTFFCETLDIACCIVMPQQTDKFLPSSIPLDSTIPSVGDTVRMISCAGMSVSELIEPQKWDGSGQLLQLERSANIRIGSVTGVYESGLRHYKFPCFTTSIPAEPGMSGGFVFLPKEETTVAACGIVSGDISIIESRNSMLSSGDSVIACAWPALGLRFPDHLANEAPQITVYDLIKSGRMRLYGDSINKFETIKLNGDDIRLRRKVQ